MPSASPSLSRSLWKPTARNRVALQPLTSPTLSRLHSIADQVPLLSLWRSGSLNTRIQPLIATLVGKQSLRM